MPSFATQAFIFHVMLYFFASKYDLAYLVYVFSSSSVSLRQQVYFRVEERLVPRRCLVDRVRIHSTNIQRIS